MARSILALLLALAACGDPDCPDGFRFEDPRCVRIDAGATADAAPTDAPPDTDGTTCPQTLCGDECVDTMTDSTNCGRCDNPCAVDLRCQAGSCVDPIVDVEAGYQHTCALRATGAAYCWGDNRSGELGDGSTTDRHVPTPVPGLTDVVQISPGGFSFSASRGFTCARRRGGQVVCWGNNESGTLGDGGTTSRSTPQAVEGISDAIDVTAGSRHACAVRGGGSIYCWGANESGQLGNGSTSSSPVLTPVPVTGISDALTVSAGARHTCAVVMGGRIKCWGFGENGALGENRTISRSEPVDVVGIDDAIQVLAGLDFSCAVRESGVVACWGTNQRGNLARSDGDTTAINAQPLEIAGGRRDYGYIAGRLSRTCGVRATGAVWCWGIDSELRAVLPSEHAHFASPVDLAVGDFYECAVTADGGVACIGANLFGQLGDGTTEPRDAPVMAVGLP